MIMFYPQSSTWLPNNLWYVLTGGGGSFCFMVGGYLEGEHNNWRQFDWETWSRMPVQMSLINFLGATLFLWGYLPSTGHWASHTGTTTYIWMVATPFTVGSILFALGSWMALFMWKQQQFGLGFAKTLEGHSKQKVNVSQHIMIIVYLSNICMAWSRLAIVICHDWGTYQGVYVHEILFRLFAMHGILLVVSAIHTTPDRHPYDYLLWGMRFIAVYGFVGNIYLLWVETADLAHMKEQMEAAAANHTAA